MAPHTLGNRELIRDINRSAVLNLIKTEESISRAEIARRSGLSPATVTGIVSQLIEEGLVYEKEEGDSRGGRKPILLALNKKGGYVVGIKLMSDHAIGALTDLEATIITKQVGDFEGHSIEEVLDTLETLVGKLRGKIESDQLLGVGIGLPGLVDADRGILKQSPFFQWFDVPLVEHLESRLGLPVYVDNDVNTLTLVEQLFGDWQDVENFILVTIGRGVGLGIVVNGNLYRGAKGGGGEFGHTVIDPNGPLCACGKRGCLETFVADPALLRLAGEAVARGEIPGEVNEVEDLFELAHKGNQTAKEIYTQAGQKLGWGIANLINVLSPEIVIISGEGARAGDLIFKPMREAIKVHVMPGLSDSFEIHVDPWEDDDWARGAASLILQQVFHSPFETA
jgi:predicted NBD/HSP70 family sugar kinase